MNGQRLYYPATARNRDPILAVLREVLPRRGLVLEVASGSGEHVVHFAEALPHLDFQPSDPSSEAVQSIEAWRRSAGLANIRPAITLDAAAISWPAADVSAVLCINMSHISPWQATEGLMRNAAACLPVGAPLYLYGPYKRGGRHTAPSNEAFDMSLRARDPGWGVRDLEAVAALAAEAGFSAPAVTEMPANNLSLVFRRTG